MFMEIFYFLLPAAFANMAPVIFHKVNFLNYPIDFGVKIFGKRLFGENKTFRGLFFGVIFSILISILQYYLYSFSVFENISLIECTLSTALLFGLLSGMGALGGDLLESLIKRQINFKPGEKLIFFDQSDWVIGAFIATSFLFPLPFGMYFSGILLFFLLHILTKHTSYYLGIEKKKW